MGIFKLEELPAPPEGRTGWPWDEGSPQPSEITPTGRRWPRISVVTPSYNQGRYIEETIRSVLLQQYPDLEYIVMDGGSTDETIEILERYASLIEHIRIGPDEGQADAIATGFEESTGEILAWLNSDDFYLPGALQRVGSLFAANEKVVFLYGDVYNVDEQSNIICRHYAFRANHFIQANLGDGMVHQPGSFWRRTSYRECGGIDRSLHYRMDADFFTRLTAAGKHKRIPGPPLTCFRWHEESKTFTMREIEQEEGERLRAEYGWDIIRDHRWIPERAFYFWRIPKRARAILHRKLGWGK